MPACFVFLCLALAQAQAESRPLDLDQGEVQYDWLLQKPVQSPMRERVLERLHFEYQKPPKDEWAIFDGCPRVPTYPAAMAVLGKHIYVATENRLERFEPETMKWSGDPIELPESVGSGLVLIAIEGDRLILASGGDRDSIWEITPESGERKPLPGLGRPIGLGAALTEWQGDLYLVPGNGSEEFWVLRRDKEAWIQLGRIGGKTPYANPFGPNSGFLASMGEAIYAWPNHHIHRFNAATQDWRHRSPKGKGMVYDTWVAMKFLPTSDGGGVATADGVDAIYVTGGFFSRSLNRLNPATQRTAFLQPRLPYPMIGEGDRLEVAWFDGIPYLVVYAIDPENKLCAIPLTSLGHVPYRSDEGDSPGGWKSFHDLGGGNGVRHWSTRAWKNPPTATDRTARSSGTLGVLGALDGGLFTMRRAYTRRIDLEDERMSFYPGENLGETLGLGACGVFDGKGFVYLASGRSRQFLRSDVSSVELKLARPKELPPKNQTALEVLPDLPEVPGRCASMAYWDGAIYALRGGGSRDFWRFDPSAKEWRVLEPLPPSAIAIGDEGAGLAPGPGCILAATGNQVWRYDILGNTWLRFGVLDFPLHWDGGMVAGDGEESMYVVRGGFSTRLGRVDLQKGTFEELFPRAPDTISAEGNRLAVVTVAGERRLYLHRGHNSNEVLWIALADLTTSGERER